MSTGNKIIIDEAAVNQVEEEGRISDDMMEKMNAAIGAPQPLQIKRRKSFFTHAQLSLKKRAAKRKAERQNKRKGR